MKKWTLASAVFMLGLGCLAVLSAFLGTPNDNFVMTKRAAGILLTKAGDNGSLVPFKTIQNPEKIAWFSERLNKSQPGKYEKYFGAVFGPQIFVDDNGNVIAATVCRMPENVVCLASVRKTEKGYVLTNVADDMGIKDKEYVQKAAEESGVKALP